MTEPGSADRLVDASSEEPRSAAESFAQVALHHRGYLALLLMAALIGIPLSLVAFFFLVAVHELEHLVWDTWPHDLGFAELPAWWPILIIGLAAVVVAAAVKHLPGHGGHVPVDGLGGGPTQPVALPGIMLAATASLVGGAVVGPEAPLIAIGSGLAVFVIRRTRAGADPTATTVLAAAGSAAAISAIFGNPIIAAIMFLEILGLGRRQLLLVVLPCMVASGVGALIFTGLGGWTGFEIGALAIPNLQATRLDVPDVAWTLPLAAVVAAGTWLVYVAGQSAAKLAESHLWATTVAAGLIAGASAAAYSLLTGRSPAEVALSGQATMSALVGDPGAWSTGALVAVLGFKGIAYAVCLGTFRGGPAFPAIFLGAAAGVLASSLVPSITLLPAVAIGMAAGVTVIGLPVTSVILVVLLLGDPAASLMPVIIVAVVGALVVRELLTSGARRFRPAPPGDQPHLAGATP